jgi:hypothetical protein
MSTTERSGGTTVSSGDGGVRRSRFVDWLTAGVLGLGGLVFALGGVALLLGVDRAAVARAVAEGTIRSDVLGPAALVDVVVATATWGGGGLLVTGLGTWIVGGWFLLARRRERRAAVRGTGTTAVVGAVTTAVLGFVPLSPVLGGLAAGYLRRGDRDAGLGVGGLSGLLAALPVVAVLVAVIVGLLAGTGGGAVAGVVFAAGTVAVALLFVLLFSVALGALGGLLGVELADRAANDEAADEPGAGGSRADGSAGR